MNNLDEIIMLVCCLPVLGFVASNYGRLKRFPAANRLIASFCFLFLGSIFTLAEDFALYAVMNAAEHLSYLVSSVLLASWAVGVYRNPTRIRP